MNNLYTNIKPIKPKSFMDSVVGSGHGYVVLSHTTDPQTQFLKSECIPADRLDLLTNRSRELGKNSQVYFGVNRRSHALPNGERGGNGDVGNISMIWMDIDVSDPKKKDKNLPRTQEEALTLLDSFPIKPTYVISSGKGVHAYYALHEEIVITSEDERRMAQEIVKSFYRGFAEHAIPFKFDPTHDLSRMLRFPGSWNFKEPESPRPVEFLIERPELQYSVAEIQSVGIAKPSRSSRDSLENMEGQMDVDKVRKGCSWVDQAIKFPRSVKYSEWFALASILYFAKDGRARFHEWSKDHPEYDFEKADAVFDQVNPEKAKRTCESIASTLHGESFCGQCPFKGGIHSPVDLGLPGKRSIVVNSGSLPSKTAQAWSAIFVANDPKKVFSNRTGILRINPGEVNWDVLDSKSARHVFSRTGDWVRINKDGDLCPTNPEQVVIDDLLETINPPLPFLKKVTSVPVITSDGRLVQDFGYDEVSQIYRVRSLNLTREDLGLGSQFKSAQEAVKFIFDEVLVDFPFASQQDKAHALALMLHDFARNLFDGPTPFFLIDKPIHGTGATLLAGVLCYPSLGKVVANKTLSSSEEEVRKQITTHLKSGGGPYLYDNLPDDKVIDSNVLASVVTADTFSDRELGTNTAVELVNLGPWIGTGNNPDFAAQMKRRIIRVRLIPTVADPYLRDNFLHDPLLTWVKDNREVIVDACLTIVMSWIKAGRPAWDGQTLGSFEGFTKTMGGILKHAGVDGFLSNMDFQKDTGDSESEQIRELIQELYKVKQSANFTVTELVEVAASAELDIQDKWFDLNQKTQVSKAGKLVRKVLDRHFSVDFPGGRKIVQLITGGVKHTYRLKEKSGD